MMRSSSIAVILLFVIVIFVTLFCIGLWPFFRHGHSQDFHPAHVVTVHSPMMNGTVKSTHHAIVPLDPKARQRISDYSMAEGMAIKYLGAFKSLSLALDRTLSLISPPLPSPSSSSPMPLVQKTVTIEPKDLLHLNSSISLWSAAIEMQVKQWETFQRILDYSIALRKSSFFPPKNASVMYYILLNTALGYHKSAPSKLDQKDTELRHALNAFYLISSSPSNQSQVETNASSISILQSLYGDRLESLDGLQAVQDYFQASLDMNDHWIHIFQKSIVKMKFQSKAIHSHMNSILADTTKSRATDSLSAASSSSSSSSLLSSSSSAPLSSSSSSNSTLSTEPSLNNNTSSNLVGSFLEKVSDAADSAENKLKDSEKVLEEQVNKGAALETVVRLDEKGEVTSADDSSKSQKEPTLTDPDNDDFLAEHPDDKSSGSSSSHPLLSHTLNEPSTFTLADFENNQYVLSKPKDPTTNYEDPKLIFDILILLIVSFLLAWLFESIGLPSFFGYVLTGILLGPMGFQIIRNYVQIGSLSQFGVYFLIFMLGLEFSPEIIEKAWRVSLVGTLLFTMALVASVVALSHFWLAVGVSEAVMFSLCLSLSSTAVTLKMLASGSHHEGGDDEEEGGLGSLDTGMVQPLQGTLFGASMMGISVAQDILLCFILALLPLFKKTSDVESGLDMHRLFTTIGIFGLKLFILLTVSFYTCRWMAKRASLAYSRLGGNLMKAYPSELYPLSLIVCCLCSGKLCDYFGLSMEFGCFLAGLMIGSIGSPPLKGAFLEKARRQLLPISNFFTIFFFNTIGLHVNPNFLIGEAAGLLLISLTVVVCKTLLLAFILIVIAKMEWRSAFMTGLGMSHISEFSFVIAGRSKKAGLFSREAYYIMVGVTSCCLIITPILWKLVLSVYKKWSMQVTGSRFYLAGVFNTAMTVPNAKTPTLALSEMYRGSPSMSHLTTTSSDTFPSITVMIDGHSNSLPYLKK